MTRVCVLRNKLLNNGLFKDSFWAVFGNGMGNALILLAGIIIARFLGKDLYGQYGVVKTTMFYIASFATYGLGFTSTKFVAQFVSERPQHLSSVFRDSIIITVVFSSIIALFLICFAGMLADWVGVPGLRVAFRFLSGVIVFKAITTTQIGLLAGYKQFKIVARNSMLSGLFMFIICVPLTYFGGLRGSLLSLFLSQAFNAIANHFSIRIVCNSFSNQESKSYIKELLLFSFPVVLQESSFTICHWGAVLLLTKYASSGALGLYSAGGQWNSIIIMIPSLLSNVVLSYLSGNVSNKEQHAKTVKIMLLVNFICTFIPFLIVFAFSDFISLFYGPTFSGLSSLLRVMTFSTIFECCSSVFKSELMSQGRTWLLFSMRCIRDVSLVSVTYYVLSGCSVINGAMAYAEINVCVTMMFFVLMLIAYKVTSKRGMV